MQMQVLSINRQRPLLQSLASDTLEYSKHNPAIDPVLQAIGFKPRSQTVPPKTGAKPGNR